MLPSNTIPLLALKTWTLEAVECTTASTTDGSICEAEEKAAPI